MYAVHMMDVEDGKLVRGRHGLGGEGGHYQRLRRGHLRPKRPGDERAVGDDALPLRAA